MSLKEYKRKRDFAVTPEPSGTHTAPTTGHLYIIQKHDATRLHYDFRLQLGDVLKSWAVPKGPSLDPKEKRLAVEVEDHPLDYGSFEGTIPEGEYGGGTVMLWDRGTWEPVEDPVAGLKAGKLKFNLHGEKLHGSWALVRTHGAGRDKPQWLLIKHRDEFARESGDYDVEATEPLSVATGRNLDEIAAGQASKKRGSRTKRDAVWSSNRSSNGKAPATKMSTATRSRIRENSEGKTSRSTRAKSTAQPNSYEFGYTLPRSIVPELATLVDKPPEGDQWLHEIKFDGYRILGYWDGRKVSFRTRNDLDWTKKLTPLAEAFERLELPPCVLDGEIVVFDEQGVSQFQLLQNSFHEGRVDNVIYLVFDVLHLAGEDLRKLPLDERKKKLRSLKLPSDLGAVRLVDFMVGNGPAFFKAAQGHGLEGIISKRRDRPYVAGRAADWLKIKTQQHAEFVVGGFTDPAGSREKFGSLLIGYHEDGKLQYAGRVGTGFNQKTLGEVLGQLEPLQQKQSPFADFPGRARTPKGVHWVQPTKVAQVTFSNWTEDHQLRHPSFQGLREDKPASAVTRERPRPLSAAARSAAPKVNARSGKAPSSTNHQPPTTNHSPADHATIAGVALSHPGRVFWPEDNITKRDLAEYYEAVAPLMLPHVVNRPLSIVRCPSGTSGERFFQKHLGDSAPPELGQIPIQEKSGVGVYSYVKDASSLVALAQIAALEIHPWGSRVDKVELPDRLIFDLDPAADVEWPAVIEGAREVRQFLRDLGLESFLKTSGGKGLHLVVPVQRKLEWPQAEAFCERVAKAIATAAPDRYVANMSKAKRVGKIYIDYLRNQRGATAIAAYGTRARTGAPISLPITWQELPKTSGGDQFKLRDVVKRLKRQRRDPWEGIDKVKQSITAKMLKTLGA